MVFAGREKELELLESCYQSKNNELIVVYGRRRIGKSSLIETFAEKMGFASEVIQAAPYFERNKPGFQIDLIYRRADKVYTLCEIKYHNAPINTQIIPEVNKKCELFPLPKGYCLEKALISLYGPDQALKDSEYFDHYLCLEDLF